MSGRPARRSGIGSLIVFAIVLAVLAITLSEGLRDRVLDALFGAEEEFDYEPAPQAATASVNGASGVAGERSPA